MDQTKLDQIRESNNIVDIIGGYIPLKKSGSNYKAPCPFHDEKTPSFMVSEKKQIYKCFGCGKSGNVFTFVRDYEKVSFFEAAKILAQRVGIEIESSKKNPEKQSQRELILNVYALATNFFKKNFNKFGDEAKSYLSERNISQETIDKYDIGYALDSYSGLKNFLLKNHIDKNILKQSGLFGLSENGAYDIFRNRIMFPIHSSNGRVIAFGGRVLSNQQPGGKYINSPTTEIYEKGRELYGLFRTRYEIAKKNSIIICEGYMDFLRLNENGFTNCVAALGTALTNSQIILASRYSKNFILLYDGDKAGIKAAIKAAGNIIQSGFVPKIVRLPISEDPDSFLLKNDDKALKNLIDSAESLSKYLYNEQELGLSERNKLDIIIDILNNTDDRLNCELFAKEIGEQFKVSANALLSKIIVKTKAIKKVNSITLDLFEEEKEILKFMLQNEFNFEKICQEINQDYFLSKIYKEIFITILDNVDYLSNPSILLEKISEENVRNILAEIILQESSVVEIKNFLDQIKLRKIQRDLKMLNDRILISPNELSLFEEKIKLKKIIRELSNKVVRKTLF